MSFKDNIMNIFSSNSAAATTSPAAIQQQPTGNIDPSLQAPTPAAVDPLAQFEAMWKPPVVDPKNPGPVSTAPNFNVKPEDIQKIAAGYDFRTAITPDLMAKIQAGGPEATMAMLEAMNTMQQANFTQSALATTKIVESTYNQAQADLMAKIDGQIKSNQVGAGIYDSNPALKHQAVAPLVELVKANLLKHNPMADASEIAALANQYMLEAASAINAPGLQQQQQRATAGEIDWAARLAG